MWEQLPSHLRTALGVALILVVGVAAASFYLSFMALREVASNPLFGWGKWAWVFPLCVDAALVASEVTYIAVSMLRGVNRALPFSFIVLFGAVTVWFNIARVPSQWRAVTAIPPVAGIFMTLLIAFLLKVFARITGKAWHHAVWRPEATWMPGYLGSSTTSGNGHNGHALEGGEASDATKRALIDLYLSRLSPTELQVATGSSIVPGVAREYGVIVSDREANRQLDSFRSTHLSKRKR